MLKVLVGECQDVIAAARCSLEMGGAVAASATEAKRKNSGATLERLVFLT
jgi:hypothetical protein